MQSRMRKYRKPGESSEEAIEEQLTNDFEVHEYLNENKLESDNIDEYVRLYNLLLAEKKVKLNQLNDLQVVARETDKTYQSPALSRTSFAKEYTAIEEGTSNEMQIKKNLLKQIVETKKSLNLLKGDIGHLVSRNQSAKLLQSKIAKVKIVADDQLKRVSLAFAKDKEQIKLRNDMQKKFNKKLKNMEQIEDSSLARMKKHYVDNVLRRKEIFDKLNYIEKIGQSIDEYGDLQREKNAKNQKIIRMYASLQRLKDIIEKFPIFDEQLQHGDIKTVIQRIIQQECRMKEELHLKRNIRSNRTTMESREIHSQELEYINENSLQSLETKLVKEYSELKDSLHKYTQVYNEFLQRKKNAIERLNNLACDKQNEKEKLQIDQIQKWKISPQSVFLDQKQLKQFYELLRVYFKLFEFIQKVSFTTEIKTSQQESLDDNLRSSRASNGQNPRQYGYITWLHRIYNTFLINNLSHRELTDAQMSLSSINQSHKDIYKFMLEDVIKWFNNYAQEIKEGRQLNDVVQCQVKNLEYLRSSQIMESKQITQKGEATEANEEEEPCLWNNDMDYVRSNHSAHQEGYLQRSRFASNNTRTKTHTPVKIPNQNVFAQPSKAQRIQLLQDIDQDYYKMLKSTIKMEKQNTRKNYLFLRNFKRSKYSSRDDILEQKRFEASFSFLFANSVKPIGTTSVQLNPKINNERIDKPVIITSLCATRATDWKQKTVKPKSSHQESRQGIGKKYISEKGKQNLVKKSRFSFRAKANM